MVSVYPVISHLDHRLVHRCHIREGPAAHLYGIGMAKVCVCCKINHWSSPPAAFFSMIKESRGDCKCANQRVRKRNAIYSGSVKI